MYFLEMIYLLSYLGIVQTCRHSLKISFFVLCQKGKIALYEMFAHKVYVSQFEHLLVTDYPFLLGLPPMNPSSISLLQTLCEGFDSRRAAVLPPGRNQERAAWAYDKEES